MKLLLMAITLISCGTVLADRAENYRIYPTNRHVNADARETRQNRAYGKHKQPRVMAPHANETPREMANRHNLEKAALNAKHALEEAALNAKNAENAKHALEEAALNAKNADERKSLTGRHREERSAIIKIF